ncbi:helix-turn-helix domain-containing protein [Actinomadura sp. SCN-SB]|uniref:helix-turn-helix domain-containing protein n=1 Tax=Actinomadura sp. SCN-SB TaxID=3373092 RepID=UPI003753D22C
MPTLMDGANDLGRRVREERGRRGWSLARLAEVSGVSRAMISKIERGESSPTAVILGRLSAALELSMTELLSPADGAAPDRVRRAADTPSWTDPGTGYLRRQISTPKFPADVTEILLPAGARVPMPAASFAFIAQLIWVLDGELTLLEGATAHRLTAGDTVELGRPQAREFVNDTTGTCRYVVVVTRKATA